MLMTLGPLLDKINCVCVFVWVNGIYHQASGSWQSRKYVSRLVSVSDLSSEQHRQSDKLFFVTILKDVRV